MIAYYLHAARPESVDRARGLIDRLDAEVLLVSPDPAPVGWTSRWTRLPDPALDSWRSWLAVHGPATVLVDGPSPYAAVVNTVASTLAVVAAPGGGEDGERGEAYSHADVIVAPWAASDLDRRWPRAWAEKTVHVGAVGWRAAAALAGQEPVPAPGAHWHCLSLAATGAGPAPRERRTMMVETPGWHWVHAPERGVLESGTVWSTLRRAQVVVCTPSSGTLAALAAARVPAVLTLPTRPTHAQDFLAGAAELTAPVVVVRTWPRPEAWRDLLETARVLDGDRWSSWDAPERLVLEGGAESLVAEGPLASA